MEELLVENTFEDAIEEYSLNTAYFLTENLECEFVDETELLKLF